MENDLEMLKMVVSASGVSGIVGFGVWKVIMGALNTFIRQQEEINRLHTKTTEYAVKRAERLESKLDDCEKKHDEVHRQIGQLREDNGVLKGKVQAMEIFTVPKQSGGV